MKTIASSDIIFATISRHGGVVASITVSGIKSLAELLAYLRRRLGNAMGLVTLSLRNSTQGWSERRTLMMA